MRCHDADELARRYHLGFLPELREMRLIAGQQVICTRGICAFDKLVVDRTCHQNFLRDIGRQQEDDTLGSVRFQGCRDEDVGIEYEPERDHPWLGFYTRAALMTWSICREVSLSVPLR